MPKKTKEQKLLAQRRRMMQVSSTRSAFSLSDVAVRVAAPQAQEQTQVAAVSSVIRPKLTPTQEVESDTSFIGKDILRIVVYTAALLSTELVLFYLLEIKKILF